MLACGGARCACDWRSRIVDPQSLTILHTELDSGLDHSLIDGLHGVGSESVEGAIESIMLGHALAVKVRKGAQSVTVIDAFAQLAIIPVFDPHEDERAQGLGRGNSVAAGVGVLQPAHQILAHLLDQRGMVVQESEDGLEERVEVDALVSQFEIGKAELGLGQAAHAFFSGRSSWRFNSQMRSKVSFSLW